LSQWRGYAGSGYGYSLGFGTAFLKALRGNFGFVLGKCVYDELLQEQIVKETLEYLLNVPHGQKETVRDFAAALQYGAFFKNPSFSEEREWRLVSFVPAQLAPIQFRKGKLMIIPYTSVAIGKEKTSALDHVCVGPCPHMELSKRSVENLLVMNNITPCVYPSSIPFRDW